MIDFVKDQPPVPPPTPSERAKSRWVADLAIAMSARLNDGQRMARLGEFYDRARADGIEDAIERFCVVRP